MRRRITAAIIATFALLGAGAVTASAAGASVTAASSQGTHYFE